MQTFFLCFGLAGFAVSLAVLAGIVLCRIDARPVLDAVLRIRRLPMPVQVLLVAFLVQLIVVASTKTNETGHVGGGAASGPVGALGGTLMSQGEAPATVFGFTTNQLAAGFVLTTVGIGGSWSFEPFDGANVVSDWLLRGAVDDCRLVAAFPPVSDAPAVFADGRVQDRVRSPSRVYAPFNAPLGVVPEANWGMIAGSNAESMVWHAATASNTLVVTWRDVLLDRDAGSPVSVQAEMFDDGSFVYRYDLSSVKSRIENGELDVASFSNVVIGASLGGRPSMTGLADLAVGDLFSIPGSQFSISFRSLDPADAVTADRDGDGISTYEEMFTHHTDPGLYDSDGDGIGDGDEVARSLDPLAVSVPNDVLLARLDAFQTNAAYAAAYVTATNELVGYRLWDSFAATWPEGATNLVYERTVRIDRHSGWEQYYLSSRPDSAGGWSLDGLVLEWEDSDGESGTATASPAGDSMYLPLSTNGGSSVTFRLRATATNLRSVRPVYLVGYAPKVTLSGGREHTTSSGDVLTVFLEGSDSEIGVLVDRSRRPCNASLHPRERYLGGLADMASCSGGAFRYEGDVNGGRIFAAGAGVYQLPDVAVDGTIQAPRLLAPRGGARGRWMLVVLMPWVSYGDGRHGGVLWDGEWYSIDYEYPLDSGCLVREWHRDSAGGWNCDCVPSAGCGLGEGDGLVAVDLMVNGDKATATLRIGEEAIWSGTAVHTRGEEGGGHSVRIEPIDDCGGECDGGCENGDCSALEGPTLGSLKFRVPLGVARKNQVSGFAYFETEGPTSISPSSFRFLLRNDVGATVATNGATITATTTEGRGRSVVIESIPNGARLTVRKQATGELEHTWEVVNVAGDASEIRLRKISRADNVMQDWTYSYGYSDDCEELRWLATDNISGLCEELRKSDTLNEDGFCSEVRTQYDRDGNWLGVVESVSRIIGERESSALREVYRRESTGWNTVERTADYWWDTEHPARNGKLRLLRSNDSPWEYHEWNCDGFETLRVEQRNASAVPSVFPAATSNGFENASGLSDAFLTTYSYEPLEFDDAHPDDYGKARCESRYVVRGGTATLIGRIWRRYTHVFAGGYPAVCEETWRASSAGASFGDPSNAYSRRTVFDPVTTDDVPLVLRGEVAEELDESGVRTESTVSMSNGCVVVTARRWRGALQFPTYEVRIMDAVYGHVLRSETRLAGGDVATECCDCVYDDKGRLRFSSWNDGTSATNAYSCCRLLWSQGRDGRRRLRSAVTGQDRLYYAEEEVWLQDVASNGFKVTQHFMDAFGHETNTVVYVGVTPGEAVDSAASGGKRLSESLARCSGAAIDAVDRVDVRGRFETRRISRFADRDVTTMCVYADEAAGSPSSTTVETEWRNGSSATRRSWDGKWSERRTWSDYGVDGCRVDFEATEASDCGVVTNSVSWCDFLGRTVRADTPEGTTATAYDGATERILSTTWTAGSVSRTTENVYDGLGRLVGSVRDGVTSQNDETYEEISNAWWRVTTSAVSAGGVTNSLTMRRERLTGLSNALRAETVETSADGVVTVSASSYDAAAGLLTETAESSAHGTTVRTSRHGLVVSLETPDGTTLYEYDPLGRVVRETCGGRVSETAYNAAGDVVVRRTRTGADSFAEESYAYDTFGNRVAVTDALGRVTTMSYDAMGNLVGVSGAAYPVRYAYDTQGRRTLLSTTRDGIIQDMTTWQYDPATGRRLAKRYADGSQIATSYTDDGLESAVTRPSLQWRESVYDERRRLVGMVSNDGSENAAFGYDDFDRMAYASNAVASYVYALHRGGTATNEFVTVGTNEFAVERSVDASGRLGGRGLAGNGFQTISYIVANRISAIVDPLSAATYAYGADGSDAGYSLSFSGGATVTRQVVRDAFRPELVTYVTNFVNGAAVSWYDYVHDAAGRVVSRNSDLFAYNERGEVVAASLSGRNDTYAYDQIGNFTYALFGGTTNTYAANELNQYTGVGSVALLHTLDGGVASDGAFEYRYDSAGRLSAVSTGGVDVASFGYDAMGRRVRKTTQNAAHTYLYDGWNVVLELVERADGLTDTVEYYWGKDLSGTLDGAGGIGGLLYTRRNGAVYVPLYDANGNVMQYVDSSGTVVASYAYDAFGRTIAATGPLADVFPHRFSTKYHDAETGLVYYDYRFYSQSLMCWLSRDPLEEEGGLNLYAFCANAPVDHFDPYGLAIGLPTTLGLPGSLLAQHGADLFWLTVAEYYFRHQMNAPISADMLELSMLGRVGSVEHVFSGDGRLANAIKLSPEYKKIIDDIAEKQDPGNKHYYRHNLSADFNTHDLISAVGQAKIKLEGDICKSKDGSARLNLDVTVSDTYNFEWWGSEKIKTKGLDLTVGNNIAWMSQMLWYLREYHWRVEFDENRRWPW